MTLRSMLLGLSLGLTVAALGACGDPHDQMMFTNPTADAATSDVRTDARTDATVDARTDATMDVQTDVATDVRPDVTVDVRPDVAPDVRPESTAGMCVSSCTMNSECQSSCPAMAGSVWCCSSAVSMCYQNVGTACDAPLPDGGPTGPDSGDDAGAAE